MARWDFAQLMEAYSRKPSAWVSRTLRGPTTAWWCPTVEKLTHVLTVLVYTAIGLPIEFWWMWSQKLCSTTSCTSPWGTTDGRQSRTTPTITIIRSRIKVHRKRLVPIIQVIRMLLRVRRLIKWSISLSRRRVMCLGVSKCSRGRLSLKAIRHHQKSSMNPLH